MIQKLSKGSSSNDYEPSSHGAPVAIIYSEHATIASASADNSSYSSLNSFVSASKEHHHPNRQGRRTRRRMPSLINSTISNAASTSKCFSWNSPEWLIGPRLGNARNSMPLSWIHDNFQSSTLHDVVVSVMMNSSKEFSLPFPPTSATSTILDQTLCHPQGRFRSVLSLPSSPMFQEPYPTSLLDEWEFRLIYMAIHRLHHQAAISEYQLRVQYNCFEEAQKMGEKTNDDGTLTSSSSSQGTPHPYEYECKNAKFLVTALPTMGMGAALRLGAVPAIFMALTAGRIPLFIMHASSTATASSATSENINNQTQQPLPEFVKRPWPLASCGDTSRTSSSRSNSSFLYHNRQDLQCVFLPTSPCVLTHHMLERAKLVPETLARSWRRSGSIDSKLHHEQVLLVEARTSPARFDEYRIQHTLRKMTHQLVKDIIQEWESSKGMNSETKDQWKSFFQAVAHRILRPPSAPRAASTASLDQNATSTSTSNHAYFPYGHREFKLAHAALLYILRPNYPAAQRIHQQVQRAIQPNSLQVMNGKSNQSMISMDHNQRGNTDPSQQENAFWLGLPIRGSDKCKSESTCLPFSQYMKLSLVKWQEQQQLQLQGENLSSSSLSWKERGKIILTSEDQEVLSQRLSYKNWNNSSDTFPLDFVVNEDDVAQGTGLPMQFKERADDIMISSLVALKLQLHATVSVGNCCSNFYLMLLDLLRNGCGRHEHMFSSKPMDSTVAATNTTTNYLSSSSSPPPSLQCLQETADPQFRVCCGWTRTDECHAVRKKFGEDRQQMRNTPVTSLTTT